MGCSTNGKGDKQKSGKTARGAKGGGKGSGGGAKTGKGRGAGVQDAPAWAKQIVNELANLKKKAEGKDGWKEVKNGKFWTCPACGDERCFTSRSTCHNCGDPRPSQPQAAAAKAKPPAAVPQPPGLPAAAGPADPMNTAESVESPIEDRILEAEGLIRAFKGLQQTPVVKAMLDEQVVKLKSLKDQQKEARPPLARLQAAMARNAAAQAAWQASIAKKAEAEAKLEEATKEEGECGTKAAETEEEVRACTELLATSAAVGSACQASRLCEFLFTMLPIGEADKQALAAQVQASFPAWLLSHGAQQQPQQASGPAAGSTAAAVTPAAAGQTAWVGSAKVPSQVVAEEKAKREAALSAAKNAATEHVKHQAAADASAAKAKAAAVEAEIAAQRQAAAEAEQLRQAAAPLQPQHSQQPQQQQQQLHGQAPLSQEQLALQKLLMQQRRQEQQQQQQRTDRAAETPAASSRAAGGRGSSSSRSRERRRAEAAQLAALGTSTGMELGDA